LNSDPDLEVIGWAANGEEGVRATTRLKPDIVTMDLRMPVMDGIEAARRIMQQSPTPIVMVTASAIRTDERLATAAIQAGILAIVEKPRAAPRDTPVARDLLRTLKSMAEIKVVRRWAPERFQQAPTGEPRQSPLPGVTTRAEIVAIGASTGGPQVLHQTLTQLPRTFSLPILIVQHIASGFAGSMAEWLASSCALPVQLAVAGCRLESPGIHIAPTDQHLVVRGRALMLTSDPPISGHRPSATVLFRSVAHEYGPAAVGVLLTGMGDDGAAGLADLKRAGAVTIAQDEASSVVFGMPGVAIKLGAAGHILAPAGIAPLLVELAERVYER
jgi:two-component system chemotaxis response regulator CheB